MYERYAIRYLLQNAESPVYGQYGTIPCIKVSYTLYFTKCRIPQFMSSMVQYSISKYATRYLLQIVELPVYEQYGTIQCIKVCYTLYLQNVESPSV